MKTFTVYQYNKFGGKNKLECDILVFISPAQMPKTPSRLKAPSSLDPVPLPESVIGTSRSGIPRKRPSANDDSEQQQGPLKQIKVTASSGSNTIAASSSSSSKRVIAKPAATKTAVAVKRTLAPAKENLAKPSSSGAAAASAAARKKRPAWDTKGRLEDMETLTSSLKTQIQSSSDYLKNMSQKLEESEGRVQELESFRSSLESKVAIKEQEAGSLSLQLQELQLQLQIKERERSDLEEQLEKKRKVWTAEREEMEGKISNLQAEKRAFEVNDNDIGYLSFLMIYIEYGFDTIIKYGYD